MAEPGKVTIRVPSEVKRGDVVRIRSLVIHPMEIVQRKDGKPIEPGTFKITFLDTHGGKYEGTAEIKF